MFLIACVVGLAVAVPVKFWTDTPLESWKIFIVIHGVIFWPWFVRQAVDKKQVSLLDVRKAAKEKRYAKKGTR
jgi:hypothetical protein